MGGAAVSTPRTDALCARLQPLADSLSVDNFGEVTVQCIADFAALSSALERELADARTVITELLANAVPVAAESGDAGMVYVEMSEVEWQCVVEATARAKAAVK